ncbi:MAG: hypothetical protein K0B16_06305 [Burkholderiaceae bacterium]|nr:hypothetical protein [Burkholderiaceae bacterium]
MARHLVDALDDENFRQGDIIKRYIRLEGRVEKQWGMILNADCDIEQRKNSNQITWLEIISADRFLEEYWAVDQLKKFLEKQISPICDQLNAALRKNNPELRILDADQLCRWLSEDEPQKILQKIGVQNPQLCDRLLALRLALRIEVADGNLHAFKKCSAINGAKKEKLSADIKSFFKNGGGFADFILVPGIPGDMSCGFVVLLRQISGTTEADIYRSEVAARVDNRPEAFHRIGRFDDGLRFQIVQKLAFLFSRIGSPREFEDACDIATELLIEDQINKE